MSSDPARDEVLPSVEPLAGSLPGSATVRRAVWGVVDQAVYSITNFSLAILVAGAVSATVFGAFAVLFIIYTLAIGMSEALTSEVYTVLYSGGSTELRRDALRSGAGASLVLALGLCFVALISSRIVSGPVSELIPVLALMAPGLFVQDFWRFAFFALGRPRLALANDITWAVVQVLVLIMLRTAGYEGARASIFAWGAGGLAGAVLGSLQTRAIPSFVSARRWLWGHRALGFRFAGEWVSLYGCSQAVLAVVGATSGLADLGKLRGAQLIFGPLQGILNGARLSLTSVAVRSHQRQETTRLKRLTLWITLGMGAVCSVWAGLSLLLPTRAGTALLGASWPGTRQVLPPVAASQVAFALALGSLVALRATQAARKSSQARSVNAVLICGLGCSGAILGGAYAAAVGVAIANAIGLVLLAGAARSVLRSAPDPTR